MTRLDRRALFWLSHVLSPREALAGFGDPVVILIAAVFIVGEGLVDTAIAIASAKRC
jgi:di/tricarboxylate transporter